MIYLPLIFACIALICIWVVLGAVIVGFFYRVPYVPSRKKQILAMIEAAHITPQDNVVDLGAGDGKVLFLAEQHSHAKSYTGYEYAPLPLIYYWFKKVIKRSKVLMKQENFFEAELKPYTVFLLYLLPETLDQLLPKMEKELTPGTRVVSNVFKFAHKEPIKIITEYMGKEIRKVYVYEF